MQMTIEDLHLRQLLDSAARDVRTSWEEAMAERDHERTTLLTEVGQAVHRALIAFDGVIIG